MRNENSDFVGCLVTCFAIIGLIILLLAFSYAGLSDLTDFDKHTTLQHVECYSGSYKIFDENIYVWKGLTDAHYNLNKEHITLAGDCIFTPVEE